MFLFLLLLIIYITVKCMSSIPLHDLLHDFISKHFKIPDLFSSFYRSEIINFSEILCRALFAGGKMKNHYLIKTKHEEWI